MSQRHPYTLILILGLSIIALLHGCSEVTDISTQIAQESGMISADEATSIKRSSKAIEKTQQELTPE